MECFPSSIFSFHVFGRVKCLSCPSIFASDFGRSSRCSRLPSPGQALPPPLLHCSGGQALQHCCRPCLAGWLVGPPPPLAGRQAAAAAAGVQEAWPPLLGSNETILHICYFYVKNILDSKMCKKNPRHNNKHNNHDFISIFHEFKVNKFISHNYNFNLEEFHLI